MGEAIKSADFFPRRVSQYVPAMQYAADVQMGSGVYTVELGSPAAVDANGLLAAVDASAVGTITVTGNAALGAIGAIADAKFGRNVTMTANGTTPVVIINGYDYLGQPMSEQLTGSGGAATGNKAFYEVTSIAVQDTNGDSAADFGWGTLLGVPYKSTEVLTQRQNGSRIALSGGLIVTASLDDPQTITSGDPRGMFYSIDLTLNNTPITITAIANAFTNSSGNGGLHGIAHYSA